ncbi:MAG: hypothetical protein V8S01_05475 [Dorea sp.]
MAMYILKALCVIGILLNVILMAKKTKELRANPEKDPELGLNGEELWKRGLQPRNLIATCIIGFFANFSRYFRNWFFCTFISWIQTYQISRRHLSTWYP